MRRVVLLKTQLVKAAKLAVCNDFPKQCLAVILIDNFIEIQLSELMKKQFAYDGYALLQGHQGPTIRFERKYFITMTTC